MMSYVCRARTKPTRFRVRLAVVFLAGAGLAACASEDKLPTTPGSPASAVAAASIYGPYDLARVDGRAVPTTLSCNAEQYRVRGGALRLRFDASYLARVSISENGVASTYSDQGSYTVSGNTVTFRSASGYTYAGTISGKTVVVRYVLCGQNHRAAFTKRT
jgi:hypothetical protein